MTPKEIKLTREELYDRISEGVYNPPTLQAIHNELKYGKQNNNRYDVEIRRRGFERNEILAEVALICRADERTISTHPRGVYEREAESGKRQERLIEQYAKKTGCWIEERNISRAKYFASGGESDVYQLSEDTVLKINTTRYTVSPQILLDRIAIHNTLFPSTHMTIKGFGRKDTGEFFFAYAQPYILGKKPTKKQIYEFLKSIFEDNMQTYGYSGYDYKTDYFLLDDFHDENLIIDERTGKIKVIDSDMRFNTPELGFGGKYIIPPVEEDFLGSVS